ncbi:MAG TPA: NADH-quinone oxidoreductase subunit M [Acidimicrobiia bacterium]|jgi:NADH-quinone oxidoreductase subunit M|nr:NADH-quinone oxidoreductase chain 13 [Acidimicrobiaceae bacterium]HIM66482.1 NADH-quinone oxidoreductase subunit M [Acidimicrobiia bacterium]
MEYLLDGWGITLATFSPLVGVAIMLLIPREREDQHRMVALVTSLWVAFVGLLLLFWFDLDATGRLQYVVDEMWIDVIRSRYMVGIDGMSLPLILLTMLIVPLCIIYSWDHFPEPRNPKAFLILILILETGMIGTFVAQDMVLFFVFFEIVLLPMFFMIAVWGGPNRRYASLKFFLFTLFGSALMLVSFLALFFLTGAESFVFAEIADNVLSHGVSRTAQLWIFGGMFLGFGIKVPMFPFHTWLPDAHTEAPTVGSVILAAVLLKLGTYGFIRVAIPILPEAAVEWAPWIGLLAVVGIIYGALGCLAQTDMKRLIAFSSVAHMGFVMLAIATLTDFGINAAIMGMVAHGLITGMLFFLAGSIKERYHTLEISRLGGLLVQAPRMGWIFGICAMASLGLPGLAGFWGEFPAILSAYSPANGLPVETFRTFMVIAALGTVLAAGYLLWLLQRVAFGSPPDEFAENPDIVDVTRHEWLAWAPILAFIVAIGIYPNLVFRVTDGAVDASLNTCLKVNVVELSAAEIEALGCADVYDIGGGDEHAAVGG